MQYIFEIVFLITVLYTRQMYIILQDILEYIFSFAVCDLI